MSNRKVYGYISQVFCPAENRKNPIPASYSILKFRFLIKIFKFHIRYFYHTKIIKCMVLKKKKNFKKPKISPWNSIRILFLRSDFKTADIPDRVNENSPWFDSADKPLMLVYEQLISVGKVSNNYLTSTLIMFATHNEWDAHLHKIHNLLLFLPLIARKTEDLWLEPMLYKTCTNFVLPFLKEKHLLSATTHYMFLLSSLFCKEKK